MRTNQNLKKTILNESEDELSLLASCYRSPGERLTYIRKLRGMTLDEAGKSSELGKSEVYRLETNQRRFLEKHARKLAAAYDIGLERLAQIMAFDQSTQFARYDVHETKDTNAKKAIRCFHDTSMLDFDAATQSGGEIYELDFQLPVSDAAFGVFIGADRKQSELPPGTLAIVDPAARTVLGDMVFQPDSDDVLFRLDRNPKGELVGLVDGVATTTYPMSASVRTFAKVVALFLAPHLYASTTASGIV